MKVMKYTWEWVELEQYYWEPRGMSITSQPCRTHRPLV